jgi:hypothetical protein
VPYTKQVNQTNVMAFVSWSVAPKSNPDVDDYGSPMIVYRNDIEWMEVTA